MNISPRRHDPSLAKPHLYKQNGRWLIVRRGGFFCTMGKDVRQACENWVRLINGMRGATPTR